MSDDLDLSAYEKDVIEHVLVGRARARMLEDLQGGRPWNADLARGTLSFGQEVHRAQVLGTFSLVSKTFLWAWANPGADGWGESLGVATALRQRGALPGQAVFREPKIAEGWVGPSELSYVSGELAGGHPVFVGRYDGGAAFLLVMTARLPELPLPYVGGVLLEIPEITVMSPRICARRFAERLGFRVQDGAASFQATRADGGFEVTFDPEGRITRVTTSAGGT